MDKIEDRVAAIERKLANHEDWIFRLHNFEEGDGEEFSGPLEQYAEQLAKLENRIAALETKSIT